MDSRFETKNLKMAAPTGNSFWKLRKDMSEDGRKLSVDEIIEKAQEYIDRCYSEKLYETDFRGKDANEVKIPHMISMSVFGLCVHLGIGRNAWYEMRKDEKYKDICTRIEDVFKAYNVEGAGAGMLNQSIIARLEGLTDKKDLSSSDGTLTPKPTVVVQDQKTAKEVEKLMNKG